MNFDPLLDALADPGWIAVPGFLPADLARSVAAECAVRWGEGEFQRAGVGRGAALAIREDIRRDHVLWLDRLNAGRAQTTWLDTIEDLRVVMNRGLYLGLNEYEGHFAIYPAGGFYKAHLDRHENTQSRIITAILYLNDGWQPGDGGELKIWTTPGDKDGAFELIEPRLGTLVLFRAGDFWHEVLPANKTRMSITGWFRV
ncbi:2OG-Fe(II) oxygenase [Luteolibacter sp. LG18]|uniref:2OG-Fe(II) oxygenase n=1 Tax=Luteolibacter sp. LG18 TaxID=2819286 RepID=UPI002B28D3D4|nr:2OG-Fe(II) oxygenase [Luteolibacter sp. LG18]